MKARNFKTVAEFKKSTDASESMISTIKTLLEAYAHLGFLYIDSSSDWDVSVVFKDWYKMHSENPYWLRGISWFPEEWSRGLILREKISQIKYFFKT